jgi:surface protein
MKNKYLISILFLFSCLNYSFSQDWDQVGSDIDGQSAGSRFGQHISMNSDGNIIGIGAGTGYVKVYQFLADTQSWSEYGSFTGYTVSLSSNGSIIAVGNSNSNHVKVYQYQASSSSWVQLGSDINGEVDSDNSGRSISLNSDGSIIAIGASSNDGSFNNSGHVRVYQYEGSSSSWVQLGSDIDGEADSDYSGNSVSMNSDGSIVAIGAYQNNGSGNNSGHVRIYKYSNNSWAQLGSDIDGEAANDKSGTSVSINNSGSIVAIGAPSNSGGLGGGHVRVYKWNGTLWSQVGSDLDGKWGDKFGTSISLNDEGKIISVGSPHFSKGLTEVFQFVDGYWKSMAYLSGEGSFDYSGVATALSGNGSIVATGSDENDGNGDNSGHVRIYKSDALVPDPISVTLNIESDGSYVKSATIKESKSIDISIVLSERPNAQDITANLSFSGSASNSDYTIASNSITVPYSTLNSYTIGRLTVTANQDGEIEGDETLIIDIESLINGVENGTQQVTLTIESDTDGDGINDDIDNCPSVANGIPTEGTTVAGGNEAGSAANQLYRPYYITLDASGNLYIADKDNHRIQKWEPGASEGTTVAGGNGIGSAANKLNAPYHITFDASGNMYIADKGNHRIQKWTPGATEGTTVAGGNGEGSAANKLNKPTGIALDASGNLYIADELNHRVQKWAPGSSEGVTVAGGNGEGLAANQLFFPSGIDIDASGNLYIVNYDRILKWVPGATEGTIVAGGNGNGSAANALYYPQGIVFDASGNLYIASSGNDRIQKWSPGASEGVTVAGGNGEGSAANQFNYPTGIALDASGNLYVSDYNNHRIQKWSQSQLDFDEDGIGDVCDPDIDGDGVANDLDTCPNTPKGEAVDSNGCSDSQKDTDNDGVNDDVDTCPNTPTGETVDANGCSDSQKDNNAFVSTWAITAGAFELPLKDYADITVDWGDSSTSTHTDGVFPTHTYSSSATFTITVTVNDAAKDIGEMYVKNHASRTLLRTIENWGEGKWQTFYQSYYDAANLTIPATDEPDLSLVTQMNYAFRNCTSLVGTTFNDWDVSNVTTLMGTFYNAESFNGDISSWNTANVTDMMGVFKETNVFNQNISSWNTAKVTRMSSMFQSAIAFNQDINTSGSSWNTSLVTDMENMFQQATLFNGNINGWDVSNVSSMFYMFGYATSFNQNLNNWTLRTAGVNLRYMFYQAAAFNGNISTWNTTNVTLMDRMFYNANSFNGDISSWVTSSVTNMTSMFYGATAFNQDISSWNTAAVTNMSFMFQSASAFNQPLAHSGNSWNLANVTNMTDMFNGASLSIANYDVFLYSQAQNSGTNENITITVSSKYSDATSRNFLINSKSWIINDEGSSSPNNAPVVTDQTVTTIEDIPLNITLVGTDSDGDTLTYSIVVSTTNGTTILDGNKVTYTPKADYFGSDSFTFIANDGELDSKEAIVTINITSNDLDEDGVTDDVDECPSTPTGEAVDATGCSDSQKDTDADGVTDDVDTCPDTPTGETVDAGGCSDSQKDTDGDGVTDDVDECPSTPTGETVDAKGCPLPLFVENISFVKRVYPNPTDNELLVELKENSIVKKVEFIDYSGKIITPNKVEISKYSIRINVSNLNNGIYLLNISTDKEVNKVKVVIER